ncbi:hypothetical protein MTR67_022944 [Solanum verrucosum]|uniref:Uncharacterized protein n=1 Tax=Solanum verrucosum TaxID=315347 RepID=A0AAF0TRR3_SOLVR|nr:hypothetical protein MTR67_022944 [Solanum verrucosum]
MYNCEVSSMWLLLVDIISRC